jgi:TRAP-type mannitol/chloroaromatic compound transport system permease small subunit
MIESVSIFSRIFSKLVAGLNSAGTVIIFVMMILINVDVLSRFLFNAPIDGVTELVELSIVAIVFLQLGDAVRCGRLTRSDGLYSRLLERHPKSGHLFGLFFDLAAAFFFSAILLGAIPLLMDAWQRGYYAGNKGLVVIPIWPVRLILVIGCITVTLVFLGMAKKHFSAITGRGDPTQ